MQINRVNNTQTFGMPLAKGFFKQWRKPEGIFGEASEVILRRLDKTTPEHFITRAHNFAESFWVAAPRVGSDARRIRVGEGFFDATQYDSLMRLDEQLSKEYKRLAKLHKKH